jgi:PAS domain S-box-containing protein
MNEKPTYEELEKRIQELEQAELECKRSEKQLIRNDLMDYVISNARSAIAIHDRDLKYIYVSKRYLKDYKIKEQNVIGKHHYEVFPDLPQKWRDVHQRALTGEVISAEEDSYYREDGSVDWTRWECRPWYESDGSIGGIIIYTEVITDRKLAEEALINSEHKWRNILVKIPQIGVTLNTKAKITFANAYFLQLTGWKEKEVIGQDWVDMFIPENVRKDVREVFLTVMSQKDTIGFSTYENEIIDRSGMIINVAWSNALTKDVHGNVIDVTCLGVDLTERQRSEQALQRSEEKYRSMMESMKDASYICSPELHIEYMNPGMIDRVGANAIGKLCYKALYDMDEKCSWCVFDQIKKGEHVDYEVADPKDSHYYSVSNSPIFHADGTASKLTIFHDITKIKDIEAQLRQSRKMESIGTLAGGIAHDFNNLLYIISGNAELALEDIPEWNPAHASLEEIKSATLKAAGIAKQLLNFSRKTDQEMKPIGVVTVIKDALKFLRSTIPTTIDIQKHLPDADITILADPIQINQIMMNLCINASQAMEDTGGIMEIIVETVSLDEEAADSYPDLTAGDYLKITVNDTGPGIDPEIIERIFDPYFTTKEMGKGSGMGLSIVHGIVQNHSGAISVDSKLGKGTTFSLLFPAVDEKPKIEPETINEIPRGHETILFVDDEKSIADMAQKMLKRLGYKVETSLNPLQALDLFKSQPDEFDLVITDMTMPQMTGAKLSEKLIEIRSNIPVIICTGHSAIIDEEKAKQFGIAGYVMKPVSMSIIAKTIRKVLDK